MDAWACVGMQSRSSDCPTIDSGSCLRTIVLLIRVYFKHIHFRWQNSPSSNGHCRWACRRFLRRTRLDGICHPANEVALWRSCVRSHRRSRMGIVALHFVLGRRQFLWNTPPGTLACASIFVVASLQGSHGVGLQPYRKSVCRNTYARQVW